MDLVGVWLSTLCLIHCLLLPLLVAALPFSAGFGGEGVHHALTLLAVPVAGLALLPAFLRHRRVDILGCGLAGIILMLSAHSLGQSLEELVSTCGALLLVSAHLLNRKFNRPCQTACCA